jgi:uncharacterized protein (TIGR03382 family)
LAAVPIPAPVPVPAAVPVAVVAAAGWLGRRRAHRRQREAHPQILTRHGHEGLDRLQPCLRAQSRANHCLPVRIGGNGARGNGSVGEVVGKPEHDVSSSYREAVAIKQLDDERLGQGIAELGPLRVAAEDRQRCRISRAG